MSFFASWLLLAGFSIVITGLFCDLMNLNNNCFMMYLVGSWFSLVAYIFILIDNKKKEE
ncbi:MAG: hypothetical protein ACOC44_18405 [Promethearchaeia archaeon]